MSNCSKLGCENKATKFWTFVHSKQKYILGRCGNHEFELEEKVKWWMSEISEDGYTILETMNG